jgi:hypothetical protein
MRVTPKMTEEKRRKKSKERERGKGKGEGFPRRYGRCTQIR